MSFASLEAPVPRFLFVKLSIIFILLWSVFSVNGIQDEYRLSVTNGEENIQCPVKCACLGNVVDCSKLQLVSPPSGLPPWTETLDISLNKLEDNFTFALPDLPQLTNLKLNRNLFNRIPDLTLFGNITHVSISHNYITDIDGNVLQKLPYLQSLELTGNKINILKSGSFLAPNHLIQLNLNFNELSEMEPGCLDNLTKLEELRINKNELTHIVKDIFIHLTKLRILEINRNKLQQIQGLSFTNLTNLQQLRLKRNKISKLEDGAFWPLKKLVILLLDFNELTVVKKGALFGLDNLRKLSLSHNRISEIELQAWELCKEIQELDLSNNRLTHIDHKSFQFLMKLEILRLDHNKITMISDGAFENNVPNLQILELNFNQISYMIEDSTTGVFNSLRRLEKLRLASNQIVSINRNAFSGLDQLKELDLQGNNVTSIQENAFRTMPNLSKLKMNTVALVCDCGLQWLSVWLRDNHYNDAKVRCGYPHWLKGMPLTQLHHANFTCDEFPKPRIVEEPNSQMSIKGENVTLTCRATSSVDAPLHFVWKYENIELRDAEIETSTIPSENGVTEASSTLYLVNISHNHAGRYQCMVTNNFGTTYSSKAKITVLIYPIFSQKPHNVSVTSGSTARLECSADGHPSPQIAWQKDGGNDFPAARERRMQMMPTDPVLFIIDAKSADSGVYSCTAQNLAGLIVANATLTILDPPAFVKPMEDRKIIVDSSVVLECMSSGSPRPQLQWLKDGQPLQATERHFFTADDQLLIIVNTIMDDAGNYECVMNNSVGSVSDIAQLTIDPIPLPIVNNYDISSIIIITVVSCAIGTSIIWLIIIYQSRRRIAARQGLANGQVPISNEAVINDGQTTQLYLDSSSQHSKDSGTGDSTNPSNDQLQLCLPEEIVTCGITNDEDTSAAVSEDPLLQYTNHQRTIVVKNNNGIP